MKKSIIVGVLALLLIAMGASSSSAEVQGDIQRTLKLSEAPLDAAIAPSGKWLFVLTQSGRLHIYTPDGRLEGQISVGSRVDGIQVGPRDDLLLLTSRQDKTVQMMTLDFIRPIDVSGSPFKGPEDAPVVIAVFSNFECGYCRRLAPMLDQVLEKNPGNVKVVYKHFPLQNQKFGWKAAAAALAAQRQGKFWPFHDRLYDNAARLSDEKIQEIAATLGLNMDLFNADLKSPALQAKIQQDLQDGRKADVRGTPAIYINGRVLKNRSLAGFQEMIDKELGKTSGRK